MFHHLTHVSVLTDSGWKHTNPEEIKKEHPIGMIRASEGFLMCRLCGKAVNFRNGEQLYYFSHPSGVNDNCPDYSGYYSYDNYVSNNIFKELPIKLKIITKDYFCFELGVLIPDFNKIVSDRFTIYLSRGKDKFVYNTSNLCDYGFAYFDVGNQISDSYTIKFDNIEDNNLVADRYNGIKHSCLFDSITGKKVPDNADILINKKY